MTTTRSPQRHRRLVGLAATALLLTGAAACGDDGDEEAAAEEEVTITVDTFSFQPDPISVDAGTKITWVNQDAINHTVDSGTLEEPTPEIFDGSLPGEGATFELTLDEPGTYTYFCSIHPGPGMRGTINVE